MYNLQGRCKTPHRTAVCFQSNVNVLAARQQRCSVRTAFLCCRVKLGETPCTDLHNSQRPAMENSPDAAFGQATVALATFSGDDELMMRQIHYGRSLNIPLVEELDVDFLTLLG